MKDLDHACQGEVQRPQAKYGEDVGGKHNKWLSRYCQYGRDRVGGEKQIRCLDHGQDNRERSRVQEPLAHHKKLIAFIIFSDPKQLAEPTQHNVGFGIDVCLGLAEKLDPAVDQDRAKNVNHPGKRVQQLDSQQDEHGAHHQCARNSPEQHAVLKAPRHREVAKDHQEHKQVVNTERLFNHIAREEFQCQIGVLVLVVSGNGVTEEVNQNRERASKSDPHECPSNRLAKIHNVLGPMEDAQVERQHRQNEEIEQNPENPVGWHPMAESFILSANGCPVQFRQVKPFSYRPKNTSKY